MICGGWPHSNECYTFLANQWEQTFPLTDALYGATISKSPFLKENYPLIVVGGTNLNGTVNTTQVLTEGGWDETVLPPVPFLANQFCTTVLNSTSIITIIDDKSFVLDSNAKEWNVGPQLNIKRDGQSCMRIRQNSKDLTFSVIVVGESTAEILDNSESQWRMGPSLSVHTRHAQLVEDPLGGVILVGGLKQSDGEVLDTMFRLAHAGWFLLKFF